MRGLRGVGIQGLANPVFSVGCPGGAVWWLSGGVPAENCIAAFRPQGQTSLANSYINLVSPGINDAVPGVAPTFDPATGWTFDGTNYLYVGANALVSDVPLTLICYMQPENTTADIVLQSISNTTASNRLFSVAAGGSFGANDPFCAVVSAASTKVAPSTTFYTANGWYTGAAVFYTAANRAGFLDGSGKGSETTLNSITGLNKTFIGAWHNGTAIGGFFMGKIAACAFYNIALTDAQVLAVSNAMRSELMVV